MRYASIIIISISLMWSGCSDTSSDHSHSAQSQSTTKMNSTENVAKHTSDYIAIQQLINRYNDVVNHRSWDSIDQIFAANGEWVAEDPINLKWLGLEDIKVKLPASVARMEVLIQTTSGIVITVESNDRAIARSLLNEFGRNKETKEGMHSVGSYEDVIVKENGEWKFLKRKLTLLYNDQLPVLGDIKGYKY